MAKRKIFIPTTEPPYFEERDIPFDWVKGQSLSPKKKCAESLRKAAEQEGFTIYEVSRAGVGGWKNLSAFNLQIRISDFLRLPLEAIYQTSKLTKEQFDKEELGGILTVLGKEQSDKLDSNDLLRRIKEIVRENAREPLQNFYLRLPKATSQETFEPYEEMEFDNKPTWLFYNWLYFSALMQEENKGLLDLIRGVSKERVAFSDIFFSESTKERKQRYNCQARAVAQFLGIYKSDENKLKQIFPSGKILTIKEAKESWDQFRDLVKAQKSCNQLQLEYPST